MARIIGFTGLAGVGKDTAAHAMLTELEHRGKEAYLRSFAAPIRRISALLGLDPYDRNKKEERCTLDVDTFCDGFQSGIDTVLASWLTEHEQAELYAYTVEALEKFIHDASDGTRTLSLSPREFMQTLGCEGGKRVRPSLWVDIAQSLWQDIQGTVLVPDCRFPSELRLLDTLIVVVRPDAQPVAEHASEDMAARLSLGDLRDAVDVPRVLYLQNTRGVGLFEWRAQTLAQSLIREGAVD